MKKYLLFILLIILIPSVNAKNIINRIDVKAYIDEYGNGKITEIWDVKTNEGTEYYKPMGDMGNSVISNFKVSMDGIEFTPLSSWNINTSFENKKYKNGISSSRELCFGISEYGSHVYTLTYDVSNMVYNVDDAQIIYYKFINDSMNPAPKDISVEITSFYSFPNTLDVWGYGYKGYYYVENGAIKASNEGNFTTDMYTVLLVKFPVNTFNTLNKTYKFDTFDDALNMAETGTFEYNYEESSILDVIAGAMSTIFTIGFYVLIIVISVKSSSGTSYKKYQRSKIDQKDLNNFRDIPCDSDIFNAYFLANVYGLNKNKSDFLGALLLKWLSTGQISIREVEVKKAFGKETVTAFDFSKPFESTNSFEKEMYEIINRASKDDILEPKELEKWCRNNYSRYFNWFERILSDYVRRYKDSGKIVKENKKYVCSYSLHEDAIKLAGLKKYLIEFSRIEEKKPIEVKLWNYYLMYAQIFGIAKEVAKTFEKFYPEVFESAEFGGNFTYSDFIFINNLSVKSYSSASSARSSAQSYSSGGGGFSSGGGGGGSFGGGSGGGSR